MLVFATTFISSIFRKINFPYFLEFFSSKWPVADLSIACICGTVTKLELHYTIQVTQLTQMCHLGGRVTQLTK